MRKQSSREASQAARAMPLSPSALARFGVPALVLAMSVAGCVSALLTETDGPYYRLIYSDPTPLVAGERTLPDCVSSRADAASVARPNEASFPARCSLAHGARTTVAAL